MVAIIREADREPVSAVANGTTAPDDLPWRKRFGASGGQANDVRRLKQLEAENARLKKLVAERAVEVEVMKEVAAKKLVSVPARRRQVVYGRARPLGATGLHAVLGGTIGVALPEPQSGKGSSRDRAYEGAVGAVSALRTAHPTFLFACRRDKIITI
jgi:putative transposase